MRTDFATRLAMLGAIAALATGARAGYTLAGRNIGKATGTVFVQETF